MSKKSEKKPPSWLKYPGGKAKIAHLIAERLVPDPAAPHVGSLSFTPYVECCVGAGAVLFHMVERFGTRFAPVLLADANPAVRALYRYGVHPVHAATAAEMPFETLRDKVNQIVRSPMVLAQETKQRELASYFFVMNRRAMNGLVRCNLDGEFNAPVGRRQDGAEHVVTDEMIDAAVARSALVTSTIRPRVYADCVQCGDAAPQGSLIYADPPYSGGFTAYSKDGWSTDDDIRLCVALRRAKDERACRVVLSQPDTEWARSLAAEALPGWTVEALDVGRPINSDGDGRQPVGELLISSGSPS